MTEQIAFYGKGGSGKSSLAGNVAVALAEAGRCVALVGCDPGGDSFPLLHATPASEPVLRSLGVQQPSAFSQVVRFGYGGICCIEAGLGLGRGASMTREMDKSLSRLLGLGLFAALKSDVVIYDLPGQGRGESYRIPILDGVIQRAFIVTSADLTSLYAANVILGQLREQPSWAQTQVALVANCLSGSLEESLAKDFAKLLRTPLLGSLPRSLVIRHCELFGKTVLEGAPESNMAFCLRKVANRLADPSFSRPVALSRPQSLPDLNAWARGWGDRIWEVDQGIVNPGAGI